MFIVITIIKVWSFHVFLVRGARPGKNVQLTEVEIRGLCLKSREIFLSQPILLELEAPLKICGEQINAFNWGSQRKITILIQVIERKFNNIHIT